LLNASGGKIKSVLSVRSYRRLKLFATVATLCALPVHVVPAQKVATGPSVDLGTGLSNGYGGGERDNRLGIALVSNVLFPLKSTTTTAFLIGVNVSTSILPASGDECVLRVVNGVTTGECLRDFPSVFSVAAKVGVRHRFKNIVLGLYTAPTSNTSFKGEEGKVRPSLLTRVDPAVPASSRVAFVVWSQGILLPIKDSSSSRVMMGGLGMRLK
jgi:hypothetical protein